MKKQNFKPRGQNLKDYNHALEMETKIRARFTEALETKFKLIRRLMPEMLSRDS